MLLDKALDSLKDLKVLVIGDLIEDEYVFCEPVAKAGVISMKQLYSELYYGGSVAVTNHIKGFVSGYDVINKSPYIRKRRYLAIPNTKLFEVAIEMGGIYDWATGSITSSVRFSDVVLMADFGHGMITPQIRKIVSDNAKFCAVNTQTNSLNFGFNYITEYRNVDFISINELELRLPYQDRESGIQYLVEQLSKDTKCSKINVTLGKNGSAYYQDGEFYYSPAFADEIVDVVGAGDAVFAITSLLASKGVAPGIIPFLGNCAGALAIKTMGNKESIDPDELREFARGKNG